MAVGTRNWSVAKTAVFSTFTLAAVFLTGFLCAVATPVVLPVLSLAGALGGGGILAYFGIKLRRGRNVVQNIEDKITVTDRWAKRFTTVMECVDDIGTSVKVLQDATDAEMKDVDKLLKPTATIVMALDGHLSEIKRKTSSLQGALLQVGSDVTY